MKQHVNISISKPCTARFNQFSKTENGGFCKSCQKEVIDFRQMSDKQLSNYFSNTNGKTCGYFDTSQLNRDVPIQEFQSPKRPIFLKVAAVAFLSLVSLHHVQAQDQTAKTEIIKSATQSAVTNTNNDQDHLLSGIISEGCFSGELFRFYHTAHNH